MVNTVNQVDFGEKVFKNLQEKTIDVLGCWTFRCPFHEDIQYGTVQSLQDHARNMTEYGNTAQIRANHKALLKYLNSNDADGDANGVTGAVLQKEEEDLANKVVEELDNGTILLFELWTIRCPFDEEPEDGRWESLIDHARQEKRHGATARIRANHKALLRHLIKEVDDDDF